MERLITEFLTPACQHLLLLFMPVTHPLLVTGGRNHQVVRDITCKVLTSATVVGGP